VVNDCAESMVKLMEDYHGKFANDETQQQYLLLIVKERLQKYQINMSRKSM